MNTLERYMFRKMAVTGLGAFAAILAVVWVSQLVTRIDFATGTGQSILAFFLLMVAITPQLIAIALPFGVLVGVVQTLNTLNVNAELPVMAASGMGRWSVAKPALLLGILASLYTLLSAHFIEPYANMAKRQLIVDARADLLSAVISPGQFRRVDDDTYIYVDAKEQGNYLKGLFLSDKRNREAELTYHARGASLGQPGRDDILVMEDGQIHRKNALTGDLSVIRFDTYAISLAEFTSAGDGPAYKTIERPTSELLDPDPQDPYLSRRPFEAAAEVNRRFSDWLYPLLFALVGLFMAGKPVTSRQDRVATMALAFCGALAYRGLAYYLLSLASTNAFAGWLQYLVPLIAILLTGWLYRSGRTLYVSRQRITIFVNGLSRRLANLRSRYSAQGAR